MTFKDASQAVADAIAPVEAKLTTLESENGTLKTENANLTAQLAQHENGEGELAADQAAEIQASIDRLKTLGS